MKRKPEACKSVTVDRYASYWLLNNGDLGVELLADANGITGVEFRPPTNWANAPDRRRLILALEGARKHWERQGVFYRALNCCTLIVALTEYDPEKVRLYFKEHKHVQPASA